MYGWERERELEGKSAGQSVLVTKPLQTADASLSSGQSQFDFSLLQLSLLMFLINSNGHFCIVFGQ